MKLTISNELTITNPSKELIDYCNKHLKFTNPDFIKKQRMGFATYKIPREITLSKQVGNDLVLPFGTLLDISRYFPKEDIKSDFKADFNVDYNCDFNLRDYQTKAVEEMFKARGGILKAKPGAGKTQMGLALITKHKKRALWLTHTADLLNQSKKRAEMYMSKDLIGTITEGKVNISSGITFATVQTMANLNLPLYKDYWDVVVTDECHRAAGSVSSVTQFSKVLENLAARHKYGLSATIHRSDGLIETMFALIGRVAHEVPNSAIKGYTINATIKAISTSVVLSDECKNGDGTINFKKVIDYICNNEDRNKLIANDLTMNSFNCNLILSDRTEHLKKIMDLLPTFLQSECVYVDGKIKKNRELLLEQVRNGTKNYLFATYKLAKEGLDIPRLDRLYLTSPQKDSAVIEQSVGRIERAYKSKSTPIVYDYVDDIGMLMKMYAKRKVIYKKMESERNNGNN